VANLSEIPSEKSDSVNRNLANQVKDHLAKDFEKLGEIKDRLADKLKPKARENNNL
jgi:hypothetical protein